MARQTAWPLAALVFGAMALGGCAPPTFLDQAVVWQVDDRRDIPEPAEREFLAKRYMADVFLFRRLPRAMELRPGVPAQNTNALDEVPDSSWFQNRIGVRRVSAKEAARAASGDGPPVLPLVVVRGKVGGGNPGFFAKDQRGKTFLIKFDTRHNPELQTSAGVIVNRIFWTLGYNVPSDNVFVFRREQLTLAPGAKMVNAHKLKVPMTEAHVAEVLAQAPRQADGSFRALASEFLPGIPKGGFAPEGRRGDDPNDVIRHELRRELRALRVFSAWVNHTDMKEDNSLDMYVTEGGRRFLRHYLLDFGEALGGHGAEKGRYEDGYEHYWDWAYQTGAAFSFGLWKRRWEDLKDTPWLSVGAFTAEHFDPRYWREAYPYWPFFEQDLSDAYWAAKLIMRFDRPIIEAVVAEGRLTHPAAAKWLVDALVGRRDVIGRTYFGQVTPLDDIVVRAGALCGVDLAIRHGLATGGVIERLNDRDAVVATQTVDSQGRVCLPLSAGKTGEAYVVYRLRTRRARDERPVMQVHVKGGRVLGIIRVEP